MIWMIKIIINYLDLMFMIIIIIHMAKNINYDLLVMFFFKKKILNDYLNKILSENSNMKNNFLANIL